VTRHHRISGRNLLPWAATCRSAESGARARSAHAIAMDIHPVCNLRVARHAVAASAGAITMEGWMHRFIAPGLALVEQMLDGGDTCIGD